MKRNIIAARPDWQKKVEARGLIWHHPEDHLPYWRDDVYYSFRSDEIAALKDATRTCYDLFLQAGQHIVDNNLLDRFGIPTWVQPHVIEAWRSEPPALNYGRFDFGYDGKAPPKLFEFNCDTPTSLLEASIIQWDWLQEQLPGRSQFNDLHETLVEKWRDIAPLIPHGRMHFMSAADVLGEDVVTTNYLRETAEEAGLKTKMILAPDVGWNARLSRFVDLDNNEMTAIYKLYPWEWLTAEEFGRNIPDAGALWIEPIWKMIWSNKAILPILWELFPDHPNLLRASTSPLDVKAVSKPLTGREGRGIAIMPPGDDVPLTDGQVFQEYFQIPEHGGQTPIIGSWIIDSYPAGVGVREGALITNNNSSFVPHAMGEDA